MVSSTLSPPFTSAIRSVSFASLIPLISTTGLSASFFTSGVPAELLYVMNAFPSTLNNVPVTVRSIPLSIAIESTTLFFTLYLIDIPAFKSATVKI
ncbi:hypothetical protein D3C77_437170 [compost metagenome]